MAIVDHARYLVEWLKDIDIFMMFFGQGLFSPYVQAKTLAICYVSIALFEVNYALIAHVNSPYKISVSAKLLR